MRELKFREWDTKNKRWYKLTQYNISGEQLVSKFNTRILVQYTGLLDKNGKEIYEGDIVTNSYYGTCEVAWRKSRYVLLAGGRTEDYLPKIVGFGSSAKQCEVIGNIYESPQIKIGEK